MDPAIEGTCSTGVASSKRACSDEADKTTSPSPKKKHLRAVAQAVRATLGTIGMPSTPSVPAADILTIAVVTMPMIEVEYDGFHLPDSLVMAKGGVNSFYVRWLEAAGIRVVPMVWDSPAHEKLDILSQVNGVLLPGGDLDHFSKVLDAYFLEVKFIYQYALQQTDKGDEFFLWGTCQGFQMLCACAADSLSVVEPGFVDTACVMMPLNFTKEAETSKMLGATTTPPHIVEAFKSYPSTLNVHRFGVTPATFLANPNVSSALVALSTNVDGKGREFVSTMEHRSANIFGVQWHPEWPPYDFSDARILKTEQSIAVTLHVAQFIRARLQRNTHHFRCSKALERKVIERSPVTYEGFGWELFWAR